MVGATTEVLSEALPVLQGFGAEIPEFVAQWARGRFHSAASGHPSGLTAEQLDSPMMKQFAAAKQAHPEALLFFRMGDFFELFGIDALVASHVCALTLTSRDKGADDPVPMAGVPVVAVKAALKKSLEAGFKAALCDQIEDPRDTKTLVRRDIVRVLSPAVSLDLFEEDEAPPGGAFLAALVESGAGCSEDGMAEAGAGEGSWALAAVDASTGEVRVFSGVGRAARNEDLLRTEPREILLPHARSARDGRDIQLVFAHRGLPQPAIIPLHERHAPSGRGAVAHLAMGDERALLAELSRVYDGTSSAGAEVLGQLRRVTGAAEAVALLSCYVRALQRTEKLQWKIPRLIVRDELLRLDAATRSHLELLPVSSAKSGRTTGAPGASFFGFLNICATAAGARKLYDRLAAPLARRDDTERALALTSALFELGAEGLRPLRAQLSQCADLDRIVARLFVAGGSPREIVALRRTLRAAKAIGTLLRDEALRRGEAVLAELVSHDLFGSAERANDGATRADLLDQLEATVCDDPELVLGKGAFFRPGFNEDHDACVRLSSGAEAEVAGLLERELQRTGLTGLKVGFNRVFGYYLEVSRGRSDQVPADYVRRQTLANAERFVTSELKQLEEAVLGAEERLGVIERELFARLSQVVIAASAPLSALNEALALIDMHGAFARLADQHGWVRPAISDEPASIFRDLVHPVLASAMPLGGAVPGRGHAFVPNDLRLGSGPQEAEDNDSATSAGPRGQPEILLITGPNMAGKSTIMRQVALAHIMAQMGCFVAAREASVGLCDKIFTRIGSGDDLMGARSTFMVEMSETAQILRLATGRSLILMDEIGRGTSTWDGLALAWAILEELDGKVRGRTLFSTHYHELGQLCSRLTSITPMQVEVIENPGAQDPFERVVFTHRFVGGAATESYGLHVASMAGLPDDLVHRATDHLKALGRRSAVVQEPDPLPAARQSVPLNSQCLDVLAALGALDVSRTSPLEALNLLAQWQESTRGLTPQASDRSGSGSGSERLSRPSSGRRDRAAPARRVPGIEPLF